MDSASSFEQRLDDLEVVVRRQAIVIERLATEFHALLLVLADRKIAKLDDIRAAERRLDLAAETRAQDVAKITEDLEILDAELDVEIHDRDRPPDARYLR